MPKKRKNVVSSSSSEEDTSRRKSKRPQKQSTKAAEADAHKSRKQASAYKKKIAALEKQLAAAQSNPSQAQHEAIPGDVNSDSDGPESEEEMCGSGPMIRSRGEISVAPAAPKRNLHRLGTVNPDHPPSSEQDRPTNTTILPLHERRTSRASSRTSSPLPSTSSRGPSPPLSFSSRGPSPGPPRLSSRSRPSSRASIESGFLVISSTGPSPSTHELPRRSSPEVLGVASDLNTSTGNPLHYYRTQHSPPFEHRPLTTSTEDRDLWRGTPEASSSRNRSQPIAAPSTAVSSSTANSSDVLPPTLEKHPYKAGVVVQGINTKRNDFKMSVRRMIDRAYGLYDVKLVTIYAFPSAEQEVLWTNQVLTSVCQDAGVTFEDTVSEQLCALIKAHASSFRGHLRDKLKDQIRSTFGIDSETSIQAVIDKNKDLYLNLISEQPPRYCYKNWKGEDVTGYGEHSMFTEVIRNQFFRTDHQSGAQHQDQFNPLPLPTLALLFTIVQHVLDTWETGVHNSNIQFSEEGYLSKYLTHLQYAKDWLAEDPDILTEVRRDMFSRVIRSSRIQPSDAAPAVFSNRARGRLQAELAARRQARDQPEAAGVLPE